MTFGLGSDHDELAQVSSELQAVGIVQDGAAEGVQRLQGAAGISSRLVTTLLQASSGLSSNLQREGTFNSEERVLSSEAQLLTVREVAATLRVCTATVYDMIDRGELEHVRVSNAIRVVVR